MARLERLRGLILGGTTDASKSLSITALGALIGLQPLHPTITAEAGKAAWRIGENSSTMNSKKLRTIVNIAKRPIMKIVRDRASRRNLFAKKYKVSLATMEDWKVGRAHLPGDGNNWFADGSKNREGKGAGLSEKNRDTSLVVPLGPHSTFLQNEIAAILQCVCKAHKYLCVLSLHEMNLIHLNLYYMEEYSSQVKTIMDLSLDHLHRLFPSCDLPPLPIIPKIIKHFM